MKKVKILMPAYNAEKTIGKTIQSILNQTYPYFELWVIDNKSTDKTKEVVLSYRDSRIHYQCNEENLGNYGNYDRCISLAGLDYTAIYHADDLYKSTILEEQVSVLNNHADVGLVFTDAEKIDEEDQYLGAMATPWWVRKFAFNDLILLDFKGLATLICRYSCFLMCPTAMVRSEVFQNTVKKTRVDLFGTAADVGLWFEISEHWKTAIVFKRLIKYRISQKQHTYQIYSKLTTRRDLILVINYFRNKYKGFFNNLTIDIKREKLIDYVMRLRSLPYQSRQAKIIRKIIGKNVFDIRLYQRLRWWKYVLLFLWRSRRINQK